MTKLNHFDQLREFQKIMEQPSLKGWGDAQGIDLGMSLITEEAEELREAVNALDYDESNQTFEQKENIAKELADLLYVCYWLAVRVGINIDEAFDRIHASNLSKVDPKTGKCMKRKDGKVLKGLNYKKPTLNSVVNDVPWREKKDGEVM